MRRVLGFTLIEVLVALALMALMASTEADITKKG